MIWIVSFYLNNGNYNKIIIEFSIYMAARLLELKPEPNRSHKLSKG